MALARIGGRMPEAIREMEKTYQLSPRSAPSENHRRLEGRRGALMSEATPTGD